MRAFKTKLRVVNLITKFITLIYFGVRMLAAKYSSMNPLVKYAQ